MLSASPANAEAALCGVNGTYLGTGICEQIFTTPGDASFTPDASMTELQLLLVGGGGNGVVDGDYGGYGGGGGDVQIWDVDSVNGIMLHIGHQGEASAALQAGGPLRSAHEGADGSGIGGSSGNEFEGAQSNDGNWGAGAGAGASPIGEFDGGAGAVVSSLVEPGSPFATDQNCYGGGGPVGIPHSTLGTSSCGAGTVTVPTGVLVLATAAIENTGGGGAGQGYDETAPDSSYSGASGLIVARWKVVVPVAVNFVLGGHGADIGAQSVVSGAAATRPTDPTADGYTFTGWFTDAALTTKADFSLALTQDSTFYAGWEKVLAITGSTVNPLAIPLGASALLLGFGLAVVAARRRRAVR